MKEEMPEYLKEEISENEKELQKKFAQHTEKELDKLRLRKKGIEGQAMTRIEEIKARIESTVYDPEAGITRWDVLEAQEKLEANAREDMSWLVEMVERMKPFVDYAYGKTCMAFAEGGGPDQWICGSCPPCQARALLAELEEGK